jgi:hypothetical protein
MKPASMLQRISFSLLALCAAAFMVVSALPHDHEGSHASHPAQACRLCKLENSYKAAPPPAAHALAAAVVAHAVTLDVAESLCTAAVDPAASPRAPPAPPV